MKILAVDDEKLQLDNLVTAIKSASKNSEVYSFTNPIEAWEWAKQNEIEIAFLDISMPGIDGIELGKRLKSKNPVVNIIFATAYNEYVGMANDLRYSGYLLKPVTKEKVEQELADLRHPMIKKVSNKAISVKCFGTFEVFYEGLPLKFERGKTKELLAFLVDRKGASVNVNEIVCHLWEDNIDDKKNHNYLRKLLGDLRNTLKKIGYEDLLIKSYNKYAIDTSLIDCDYYDYENNEPWAVRSFKGEYMTQYSWAEETTSNFYKY